MQWRIKKSAGGGEYVASFMICIKTLICLVHVKEECRRRIIFCVLFYLSPPTFRWTACRRFWALRRCYPIHQVPNSCAFLPWSCYSYTVQQRDSYTQGFSGSLDSRILRFPDPLLKRKKLIGRDDPVPIPTKAMWAHGHMDGHNERIFNSFMHMDGHTYGL